MAPLQAQMLASDTNTGYEKIVRDRRSGGATPVTKTESPREKVSTMKQLACTGMGLVLVLGAFGLPAGAQSQSTSSTTQTSPSGSSLGDYARQVRKDPQAKAKAKVFDNDNLPTTEKLSVIGPAPASTAPASSSEGPRPAAETSSADKTTKSLEDSD